MEKNVDEEGRYTVTYEDGVADKKNQPKSGGTAKSEKDCGTAARDAENQFPGVARSTFSGGMVGELGVLESGVVVLELLVGVCAGEKPLWRVG